MTKLMDMDPMSHDEQYFEEMDELMHVPDEKLTGEVLELLAFATEGVAARAKLRFLGAL